MKGRSSVKPPKPKQGEVVDPVVETIAQIMDGWIKIGPWSFGLDGIIGLIPGIGDLVGMAASGIIVQRAVKAGLPKSAIGRMLAHIAIDSALGAIPLVGDVFDFFYKSNTRNLQVFRESMAGARDTRRDWGFVVLVAFIFLLIAAIPIAALVWLIGWLRTA